MGSQSVQDSLATAGQQQCIWKASDTCCLFFRFEYQTWIEHYSQMTLGEVVWTTLFLHKRKPLSQMIDTVSLVKTSASLDHEQIYNPEERGRRTRTAFIYDRHAFALFPSCATVESYMQTEVHGKQLHLLFQILQIPQEVTSCSPIFPDRETERVNRRTHRKLSPIASKVLVA